MNSCRYDRVLSRLERVRWHPGSKMWSACCPAHEDKNPSLMVWVGRNGNLLARCASGKCEWKAIVAATGTTIADWFPEKDETVEEVKSKCVATYEYHDPAGKVVYTCKRWEPGRNGRSKDFSYSRPQPDGKGWINNLEGCKKYPYRLPEILDPSRQNHPVFIVEGEKCVEALRWLGLLATCNPCGAEKWLLEYGVYLTKRRVVILPDNDEPGWRHAVQVAGSMHVAEAASIRIVHLPGVPDGGDIVDWLKSRAKAPKEQRKAALVEIVKASRLWECK